MSTFMTAAARRALLRRSMRPRASHVTPELNARLAADLDEQIEATRGYAEAMIEQRNHALAGRGFTEVARLEKLKDYYVGKEGDDAASAL